MVKHSIDRATFEHSLGVGIARRSISNRPSEDAIDPLVVTFSGDLDISRYPEIQAMFKTTLGSARPLLIDLSETTTVDSICLSEMLIAKRRFDKAHQKFAILLTDLNVHRMLAVTNVTERLNVYATREAALEFLRS